MHGGAADEGHDQRDGFDQADAALAPAIYDRACLKSNIAGGEGFDWFYASALDRTMQNRTPITDAAAAKPWVFRFKDLRAWWQNPHFNRPGGGGKRHTQALKWQVARADEDYDAAQVEARRITVDTTRIASESFPMAIPPEEAEPRCRRALMEAWVGRESAVFRLPPSRLAPDPCDVILLDHDGRLTEMRLVSIADTDLRSVDAVRQDRAVYDLPPGEPRPPLCRHRRSSARRMCCCLTCHNCAKISLRTVRLSRR